MTRRIALLGETAEALFGAVVDHQGLARGALAEAAAAVVCDADPAVVLDAVRSGVPVLVGAESMRVAAGALAASATWLPVLPLRLAPEVEAAQDAVADGAVGAVGEANVTSYHGRGPDHEVRPGTPFEALLWALDLAEHLTGGQVTHTRWLRRPTLAVHTLSGDVLVTVHQLPQRLGPVPAYSATVVGDRGQLMLRYPLAPGALALWRAADRNLVVPALPKGTPAPGTPGGREFHLLLQRLVERQDGDAWRAGALRLVEHLTATEEP